MFRYSALKLRFKDNILDHRIRLGSKNENRNTNVNSIAALLCNVSDSAKSAGGKHDLVLIHEGVLPHTTEYVATRYMISSLKMLLRIRQ